MGCNSLLLQNEKIICAECNHQLPYTNHHILDHNDTTKKFYGIIPIEFSASMLYFHHKGIVQNLIHNLKYKKHEEIGTLLGKWYAKDLKSVANIKTVTEIIPVPLHKKRLKERGYNQVTSFCEALSEELQIPLNNKLLYRSRYSKTQTKKDKEKRKEVSNALFKVNFTEADSNNHFLLIDDVLTSGATLEACAKALLKIPNSKVSIVTIAYTQS
ncbi:ComF family protein [Flavobacterium aquaticum]|uniref:ComF family protein n=2 Tax=Flavobacterium proteolyticum TaxID=2911683 RepID=A0ABR9WSV9_9FLAO|nr:ComF family protein [Flavobacterium proteolyticum]